jgi:hypothetical protein
MIGTLCRDVPCLHEKRDALLAQLPLYLSRIPEPTDLMSTDFEKCQNGTLLEWWKNNRDLSAWIDVLAVAVLLQPSSSSAERVFSMYSWMFDDDQDSALQDFKETALMLRYNEQDRVRQLALEVIE